MFLPSLVVRDPRDPLEDFGNLHVCDAVEVIRLQLDDASATGQQERTDQQPGERASKDAEGHRPPYHQGPCCAIHVPVLALPSCAHPDQDDTTAGRLRSLHPPRIVRLRRKKAMALQAQRMTKSSERTGTQ